MIDDLAHGSEATSAWARISATLIEAGFVAGAIGADETLGSAGRWSAEEFGCTGAYGLVVDLATKTVGSAGRWDAGFALRLV